MSEQELREKNLFYYSLISEYIDALDKWIAAPQGSNEKVACRKACQNIEPILRRERDRYKGKIQRVDIFVDTDPKLF